MNVIDLTDAISRLDDDLIDTHMTTRTAIQRRARLAKIKWLSGVAACFLAVSLAMPVYFAFFARAGAADPSYNDTAAMPSTDKTNKPASTAAGEKVPGDGEGTIDDASSNSSQTSYESYGKIAAVIPHTTLLEHLDTTGMTNITWTLTHKPGHPTEEIHELSLSAITAEGTELCISVCFPVPYPVDYNEDIFINGKKTTVGNSTVSYHSTVDYSGYPYSFDYVANFYHGSDRYFVGTDGIDSEEIFWDILNTLLIPVP